MFCAREFLLFYSAFTRFSRNLSYFLKLFHDFHWSFINHSTLAVFFCLLLFSDFFVRWIHVLFPTCSTLFPTIFLLLFFSFCYCMFLLLLRGTVFVHFSSVPVFGVAINDIFIGFHWCNWSQINRVERANFTRPIWPDPDTYIQPFSIAYTTPVFKRRCFFLLLQLNWYRLYRNI